MRRPGFTTAECGIQLNRGGDSVGGTLTMGGRDPNGCVFDFYIELKLVVRALTY